MRKILVIGCYGNVGTAGIFSLVRLPDVEAHALVRHNKKSKERFVKVLNAVFEKTGKKIHEHYGDVSELLPVIKKIKPEIVIHWGLPYDNLVVMRACLEAGVHYVDTACYEDPKKLGFSYEMQWAMDADFKKKKILALTGCGFDPGWTNAVCGYANRELFDKIFEVHILDANAGSHGQKMAANFKASLNFREFMGEQCGYWLRNKLEKFGYLYEGKGPRFKFNFPGVGEFPISMIYHEELETVPCYLTSLKRMTFWMTFSDTYLENFKKFYKAGVLSIKPVSYEEFLRNHLASFRELYQEGLLALNPENFPGDKIIPIILLEYCLPKPISFNDHYTGKTHIGVILSGVKDGKKKVVYIYNICDHHETYLQTGSNAIGFTTAIPTVSAVKLILSGEWQAMGVKNVEDPIFDHKKLIDTAGELGLPWQMEELPDLPKFLKKYF